MISRQISISDGVTEVQSNMAHFQVSTELPDKIIGPVMTWVLNDETNFSTLDKITALFPVVETLPTGKLTVMYWIRTTVRPVTKTDLYEWKPFKITLGKYI